MDKKTELSSIGEFGLIERITNKFGLSHPTSVYGIGDDAAVIDAGADFVLISTDMLNEGVHFDLTYAPLQHIGFKSIAVNVSDIAAMNGVPTQAVISLGISSKYTVEAIDVFFDGVKAACDQFNIDLVGGDVTSAVKGMCISVTIMGRVPKNRVVYRNGAKEHDILCVTGDIGAAYMGLQVLQREKAEFMANPQMQPKLDKYEYIVGRQLRPVARTDIRYELNEMSILPTAMIDISDGLASEVFHIAKKSNLGAALYEEHIPIDNMTFETAVEFNLDPFTAALNGGEDYELLFAIRPEDHEKVKNHPDIHFIGHMQTKEKGMQFISKNQQIYPLQAQGWKHM